MIGKCGHRAQAQAMACYECMQADEISNLQAKNKRLREALEFYAESENWHKTKLEIIGGIEYEALILADDRGRKARKALSEGEEKL